MKLTLQAVEALKLHRKRQYEERSKAAKWEDHGLVFPNRVGKPMGRNNLYHRDFKSLLKRARLWSEDKQKHFTFHSLRHPATRSRRASEVGTAPTWARVDHDDPRLLLALETQHGKARR